MNLRDIVNGSTVLVDTNVLLYARNHRSPLCRELLLRCESGAVNGVHANGRPVQLQRISQPATRPIGTGFVSRPG